MRGAVDRGHCAVSVGFGMARMDGCRLGDTQHSKLNG